MTNIKNLHLSLEHNLLKEKLINTPNSLIIQDLDGVCMGLVKDPLNRIIKWDYVQSAKKMKDHFFVLTNGEHIGKRGVNNIIEKSASSAQEVKETGYYLPGLAGGGVQWQDCFGNVEHPGISDKELNFLASVPHIVREKLTDFCIKECNFLSPKGINNIIDAVILDNFVSPTVNINTFYEKLTDHNSIYINLQNEVKLLMDELLSQAEKEGLKDSFFVHYAPNLGRDDNGLEILRPATETDSGTTDFQFMVTGGIKEAGVLFLLNYYYYLHTGEYPLGEDFNVRKAPHTQEELLSLVVNNFDPEKMPFIVGVGDTVNSTVMEQNGKTIVRRGGSDRNFLQLIQNIGDKFNIDNAVVYIDSSGGEIKNRKPIKLGKDGEKTIVLEGPGDTLDKEEPLKLNMVFPQGHQQYCKFFCEVANSRKTD
ncbi:glucosylglycerol 3-phosphatase GgpP [Cyanobacterium sp. HL-69]|uniref:glucosylglycerol 3-phosphatase n=1 Tax=Cyanobacterium sp. HL-69 TaxID=2054282 RepID=UPI000CA25865|nr:glucosylglycerol 3-phosphatase GgpP [Cyanobacterium sp. HL-69]